VLEPTAGRYLLLCTSALRYSLTILFEGYGDDELGFYTVYNEVFNTLAKEDMDHMDEQESDFEVMQLLETIVSDTERFVTDSWIRKSIYRCSSGSCSFRQ
jgi:hypothetical protein